MYSVFRYCVFGLIILSTSALAASVPEASGNSEKRLSVCREAEMGLKFSCDPAWAVRFDHATDMFVISEEPEVVLTIAKEATSLVSLEQLTPSHLSVLGNYADGFSVERIRIDGMKALKVKAYDRSIPDMRVTDIYVIKDGYLYKLLFSVSPREAWRRYQFLLNDIVLSLRFLWFAPGASWASAQGSAAAG